MSEAHLKRFTCAWHEPLHPPSSHMNEPSLRILLVDQNADRAAILEEGLREAGCT